MGLARSTGLWAWTWLQALPRQAAGHQIPRCAGTLLCPCLSCQHEQMGHGEALQGPRLQRDHEAKAVLRCSQQEMRSWALVWLHGTSNVFVCATSISCPTAGNFAKSGAVSVGC